MKTCCSFEGGNLWPLQRSFAPTGSVVQRPPRALGGCFEPLCECAPNNNNKHLYFQHVGDVGDIDGARSVLGCGEDASVPIHVEGERHVNPQGVRDQAARAGWRGRQSTSVRRERALTDSYTTPMDPRIPAFQYQDGVRRIFCRGNNGGDH